MNLAKEDRFRGEKRFMARMKKEALMHFVKEDRFRGKRRFMVGEMVRNVKEVMGGP